MTSIAIFKTGRGPCGLSFADGEMVLASEALDGITVDQDSPSDALIWSRVDLVRKLITIPKKQEREHAAHSVELYRIGGISAVVRALQWARTSFC